jgi:hypothetical protein
LTFSRKQQKEWIIQLPPEMKISQGPTLILAKETMTEDRVIDITPTTIITITTRVITMQDLYRPKNQTPTAKQAGEATQRTTIHPQPSR